jgi:hypothetical protein
MKTRLDVILETVSELMEKYDPKFPPPTFSGTFDSTQGPDPTFPMGYGADGTAPEGVYAQFKGESTRKLKRTARRWGIPHAEMGRIAAYGRLRPDIVRRLKKSKK